MIAIIIIGIFFVGAFKGISDRIAHDPDYIINGWKGKWKTNPNGSLVPGSETRHWWYFGTHLPKYSERFPFSSTALVFFTDWWHLSNFFQYRITDFLIAYSFTNSLLNTFFLMVFFSVLRWLGFSQTYLR
jgi:hypothetical protein